MSTRQLFYDRLWCRPNIGTLQRLSQANYNLYHRFKIENVSILRAMISKITIRCDKEEPFIFTCGVPSAIYLVHVKICKSPQDALFEHDEARTLNSGSVTVASQSCYNYVSYFANYVLNPTMTQIPDRFSFDNNIIFKRIE